MIYNSVRHCETSVREGELPERKNGEDELQVSDNNVNRLMI